MFFTILKKDLKRKKSMNFILLIFIALSATFLAGSVSNLVGTSGAVNYFGEKTNAADYYCITAKSDEAQSWVESSEHVKDSSCDDGLMIDIKNITIDESEYNSTATLFLFKMPHKYNIALSENDEPAAPLKSGEIALCYNDVSKNDLTIGDTLTLSVGGKKKDLTLTQIVKDMGFGSSYLGMDRLFISDDDYEFFKDGTEVAAASLYAIASDDPLALERTMTRQNFQIFTSYDSGMLDSVYIMEMILATILTIVSLILIIIAFVILRFTINFTLQEDYREIGVMKAIGLKNGNIKRIYSAKYLGLAIIGAATGVLISIPFSIMMLENMRHNMAIEPATSNILLNILCGLVIVLVVVLFCYLSMGKVDKISAVSAMRSGATGENFKTRKMYDLHKHYRLPLPFQMAINDVLCNMKNYLSLVVTFALGTALIILPVNAINTLQSSDIVEFFGVSHNDVYLSEKQQVSYDGKTLDDLQARIDAIEKKYAEEGIDIELHTQYSFMASIYADDIDEGISILSFQPLGIEATEYGFFDEESAPRLSNEIAITKSALEKIGAEVGDMVHVVIGGETHEYVITASYESMSMMGITAHLAASAETDFAFNSGIWAFQGDFKDRDDIEGQIERLKEITPELEVKTAEEYANGNLGGIVDAIDAIKTMLLVVVLGINCLITLLLARTFKTRDAGAIALLKSLGFRSGTIRAWQALRIIIVLLVSILVGIALSMAINPVMVNYTFGIMGATDISLNILWQEVYVAYPLILFIVTSLAAVVAVGGSKKSDLKTIGSME